MSRLGDTIRQTLDLDPGTDLETLSYRSTASWDSVAHLELLIALEEEFGFVFTPDELMDMTDYPAVREVVERRLGLRGP